MAAADELATDEPVSLTEAAAEVAAPSPLLSPLPLLTSMLLPFETLLLDSWDRALAAAMHACTAGSNSTGFSARAFLAICAATVGSGGKPRTCLSSLKDWTVNIGGRGLI